MTEDERLSVRLWEETTGLRGCVYEGPSAVTWQSPRPGAAGAVQSKVKCPRFNGGAQVLPIFSAR